MPAPLPQTPEERARQLSFLQNLMSEDPGLLRKMVAGLTDLPHRASQGEFIEPGGETLRYASQFAVPGAPESALGTGGGRPFYSKLGEAVEGMQPKATGPQLIATLRNQGVKPEELQYSGFEKQFGTAPSVTKGEATSFLADNGVRVGEVIKGQGAPRGHDVLGNPIYEQYEGGQQTTKFSQYQMPGGENYKELLLTLPTDASRAVANKIPPSQAALNQTFRSSHFDEPNVLAHIRMNDRVDANGKKTLFLEEVQSDWHQKGREGYQNWTPEKDAELRHLDHLLNSEGTVPAGTMDRYARLREEMKGRSGVPDAPFKKDWHELALKRAIKYAADNGYDSVSWTPGKVQAERYDLSKHIDALNYAAGPQKLVAWKNGQKVINENVPPDKLADYVGKEMAEKIQKDQDTTGSDITHFSGLDLKVGGEGMNAFYDKMLPAAANKLGKKYGAKVGVTKVRSDPGNPSDWQVFRDDAGMWRFRHVGDNYVGSPSFHSAEEADAFLQEGKKQEVWTIPITDAMRKEVGAKGMPLFTGGVPVPTQHQERARMLQNLPAIMGNRS